MADDRRYSLIDKQGNEHQIAIPASALDKKLTTDPKTGEPASYRDLGFRLGFADPSGEPYDDGAVKAVEKGRTAVAAHARAVGVAAVFGPEEAPEPEPEKPAAGEVKAEAKK